jgi:hypothetical protein
VILAAYQFNLSRSLLLETIKTMNNFPRLPLQSSFLSSPFFIKFLALLFPLYYLKGLVMVFTHATTGHFSYLLGEHSTTGWWYYFPVTFLVKTPLAVLLLFVGAIWVFKKTKSKDKLDEILLILPPVVFFLFAMTAKINLGVRHILPVYPFLYIFISRLALYFSQNRLAPKVVLAFLCLWFLGANLTIFPSYLAYFNEAVGGPKNGIKYLSDSNIDWGQDAKRLAQYLKENHIETIYLDYFWDKEPLAYYHIHYQPLKPTMQEARGYLVISVSALQLEEYKWLRQEKPLAHIGYSTYIYKRE